MTITKSEYYLLESQFGEGSADMDDSPDLDPPFDITWHHGVKWKEKPPERIVYRFEAGHLHPYYADAHPVMSDKLLEAFVRCGVDNIDAYPAIIYQEGIDKPITNYKIVNIIGRVSAVDEELSDAVDLGLTDDDMSPRFFNELKISEIRAHGLLLFRLAEMTSEIAIHRTVKLALEKEFDDLKFEPA